MKKEKITEDPEAFNVVKPETSKSKIPKFIKIIILFIRKLVLEI